jgi:hypothetical protein
MCLGGLRNTIKTSFLNEKKKKKKEKRKVSNKSNMRIQMF